MEFHTKELIVFFSDEFISYVMHPGGEKAILFGDVKLEPGILNNGYIEDPETLAGLLKTELTQHAIKPGSVRMVLHEQNIIVRKLQVKKEAMDKSNMADHLKSQLGKTIHAPFKHPAIHHHVIEEHDETYDVVMFIVDEHLLHDYVDMMEHLKAKEVVFDLPSTSLYRMFQALIRKEASPDKPENHLIIALYNQGMSFRIIDHHAPVFGLIEEFSGLRTDHYSQIDNYIERIGNYYTYNLHKGKRQLDHVIIFNFSDVLNDETLAKRLSQSTYQNILQFAKPNGLAGIPEGLSRKCYTPFAASIKPVECIPCTIGLGVKLSRPNKTHQKMNHLMTLAFTVFAGVSLIYIPFLASQHELNIQRGINLNLANQLEVLQEAVTPSTPVTSIQRHYSNAYDDLIEWTATDMTMRILDLQDTLAPGVTLLNVKVDDRAKTVTMTISSEVEWLMHESVIQIYEAYGVTAGLADDDRWITALPSIRMILPGVMEVTLTYA